MSKLPKPCRAKHPTAEPYANVCHFCRLGETDPAYRAWGDAPTSGEPQATIRTVPLPCVNEGGIIHQCPTCNGENKHARECDVYGLATRIPNPQFTGVHVCHIGTPSQCEHYVPDASLEKRPPSRPQDPWENPVTIEPPPSLTVKPTKPYALVTVASGKVGESLISITRPYMRAYAKRLGADYHEFTEPLHPSWGMAVKFWLARIVPHYDRTIFADADVMFRTGCLNLLESCLSDELGGYNDLPEIFKYSANFATEYQGVRKSQGLPPSSLPWYVNTGVMVANPSHAPLFDVPSKPIPPLHCAEQHLWVGRMIDAKTRVRLIGDAYNYQWWVHRRMDTAPREAVLHFSGMGDHAARLAEMRKLASQFPAESLS